jgi:hydrogenase nickel insertion protein HypA
MHEFSVISSIMELVRAEMEKAKAEKVLEIRLQVGELTFLSHEALQFGFSALASDDKRIGKDALKIVPVPAEVRCSKCGYTGPMQAEDQNHMSPVFRCPECAGPIDILSGRECVVTNIRMEVP